MLIDHRFDTFECVRAVCAHDGDFFHSEQILSNLVVDGVQIDNLYCHLGMISGVITEVDFASGSTAQGAGLVDGKVCTYGLTAAAFHIETVFK